MALTPDDVVTKQFQHVRFKEGFDPDEVDDEDQRLVGRDRAVAGAGRPVALVGRDDEQPAAALAQADEALVPARDDHAGAELEGERLRAAVDQAFVPLDTAIAGAREIAIFPPVTGG